MRTRTRSDDSDAQLPVEHLPKMGRRSFRGQGRGRGRGRRGAGSGEGEVRSGSGSESIACMHACMHGHLVKMKVVEVLLALGPFPDEKLPEASERRLRILLGAQRDALNLRSIGGGGAAAGGGGGGRRVALRRLFLTELIDGREEGKVAEGDHFVDKPDDRTSDIDRPQDVPVLGRGGGVASHALPHACTSGEVT